MIEKKRSSQHSRLIILEIGDRVESDLRHLLTGGVLKRNETVSQADLR